MIKQKGVTLLEMLMVLALSGFIITNSVRYYTHASQQNKLNTTLESLQTVVVAADQYSSLYGTFQSLNLNNFVQFLPYQQLPNSPYGGVFTIQGLSQISYKVTIPGVSQTACYQIQALLSSNANYQVICPTNNTVSNRKAVITVTQ